MTSCSSYSYKSEPVDSVAPIVNTSVFERRDTMFLPDEPREVFYNNELRSFNPNKPLQVSMTEGGNLLVKLYSPVSVAGVSVYAVIASHPSVKFLLARFNNIYAFMDAEFALPFSSPNIVVTVDGRIVELPAMPDLDPEDIEFFVESSDPLMAKVATINSNWTVNFSSYQADQGHAYWRHMTPELCRHGVALALNMAYMFSSDEFNKRLNDYDGLLTDNNGTAINLDLLREKIRTHSGLTLGRVEGVGGLGGGRTYGLADYCYRQVYWDWEENPLDNPHTYVRQAMFHEYGHCLGYSHESTMTYGDQWTVLCAECFVELGSKGSLPVCSKDDVHAR